MEALAEVEAKSPARITISSSIVKPRVLLDGEPMDLKTFKQLVLTERLYPDDEVLGVVLYPGIKTPEAFVLIMNSYLMWRMPYRLKPVFVSWNGKTEDEFKQLTGMAKREHQSQYRLWRDKVGETPRQLFI